MKKETATLAGGCFWGVEELIRALPGILDTTVGYTGGKLLNPTYNEVKHGTTDHAESIQIEFDSEIITFVEILNFFFKMHNPTTINQQGNDKGSQYRSAIFYHNENQKKSAEEVIAKVSASKKWDGPIVTQVVPASKFYSAEDYHQDYLKNNPNGYTCHWVRD